MVRTLRAFWTFCDPPPSEITYHGQEELEAGCIIFKMYRGGGISLLYQVVLLCLLLLSSCPAITNGDDLAALSELKVALDDQSGALSSWDGNGSYCGWLGIQCDASFRVISINLNATGLSGSISSVIGNLTFLDTLDLTGNQLSGTIPPEISYLPFLNHLLLSQNNLSGEIPVTLGVAGQLEHVDLSSNRLVGVFPPLICMSKKLKVLNLYHNSLMGTLPRNITMCHSLERLILAANDFQGTIPASIGSMESLNILDLSWNHFSGEFPSNFSQGISYLSLRGNRLAGRLVTNWERLKNITLLDLGGNLLNGTIPEELGELQQLNTLNLGNNNLEGPIPISLTQIQALDILDLSGNNLVGEIPSEIGKLGGNLSSLTLENNKLSGPIPPEIGTCLKLIELELANNNFSGNIPPEIGSLTDLQYGLNLSYNSLSGPIPDQLGNLPKLTKLDLSHNVLDGPVPASLGELPSLLFIDLSNNNLSGTVPAFRTQVNASQFANNPNLCFANCSKVRNEPGGKKDRHLPKWAGVLVGIVVSVAAVVVVGALVCTFRSRRPYYPADAEPKIQSTDGRLFVDPERENFTLEMVVDASLMVNENQLIGRGRLSSVYRVVLPNGRELAVKVLKVDSEHSVLSRKFVSELVKVDKMRHHNVLRILGFVIRGDALLLLYDYMMNGSLGEWLHRRPDSLLEWSTRYRILVGAAQGLSYLHHNTHPPFVHRDVNSNNILLDANFEPHLGDVGLAKVFDPSKDTESMTAVAGSFGYISPEYAYTMRVTEKGNVYSFGVVILETLTGRDPATFEEGLDLVSWVHSGPEREEMPEQILDPVVSTSSFHVRQEMLAVLKVGKLCTSRLPAERPKMKAVVEMLYKCKQNAVNAVSF
ncbi:hypothetical protein R1flu_009545 [Riccia fluitans]|uniref:Protein kinase domain-containing protein n=1 Tax=Riccia fluitans TaxID=41844 RepID=A0ABD1Z385_9MARC